MTGHEDGAALRGVVPEEFAQPLDGLRIEAVGGLIEHERTWLREDSPGEAEPLRHPQGECLGTLVGDIGEAHHGEHLIDARLRNPGLGPEHAQVVTRGAARQEGTGVQVGANDAAGVGVLAEVLAVECRAPLSAVEAQHEAHRGGLAGAIRPEEARHDTVGHGEGQVIDGAHAAEGLAEVLDEDGHGSDPTRVPASLPTVIPRGSSRDFPVHR